MANRRHGETCRVEGPAGKTVVVKFFDDGSVSFRLKQAGPMVIRYAFLPGVSPVLELTPKPQSPWAAAQPEMTPA